MIAREMARLAHFIDKNLPDMPSSFDEGLGIASERYAVNKVLRQIVARHTNGRPIQRVLEAPADGLMGVPGMNSVIFAREMGAQVVVGSPSQRLLDHSSRFWSQLGLEDKVEFAALTDRFPFDDGSFDWVWNYCTLEHFEDAPALMAEMKRVSRRFVGVVTQNMYNYGYPIHKLYHYLNAQDWDHGDGHWMRMGTLTHMFKKAGLRVIERGCVDVPPWLDTFDMHIRGKIKGLMNKDGAESWSWSSLQAGDTERLSDNRLIKWLEEFESVLVFPLDYVFAHHFYVIGELEGSR